MQAATKQERGDGAGCSSRKRDTTQTQRMGSSSRIDRKQVSSGASRTTPPANRLTVAVLSDTHDDVEGIGLAADRIAREGIRIDAVLCPGDITTMPNKNPSVAPTLAETRTFTERVRAALAAISSRIGAEMFWIPGNHDPLSLFGEGAERAQKLPGANVHGRVVQLRPGLFLAGFGGCVEARRKDNGAVVWGAYPLTEKLFKPKLRAFGERMVRALGEDSKAGQGGGLDGDGKTVPPPQLILMTHSGPSGSPETTEVLPVKIGCTLRTGSDAITELLESKPVQAQTILTLHGHVHDAPGLGKVGVVPVLNPGSTRYGDRFAVVTFVRRSGGPHTSPKWALESPPRLFRFQRKAPEQESQST